MSTCAAYATRQRGVELEQFVHDYYSVNRFMAAYSREIEPLTDKTQWPHVDLLFGVGAPLEKNICWKNEETKNQGMG